MAKNNNNRPEDEKNKATQIAAHKQAAAKVSAKLSSGASAPKAVPVNTAANKVAEKYGGKQPKVVPGAAFNRLIETQKARAGKWYSGSTPTARETVARIYDVSSGDSGKFNELMGLFDSERSNRGSTLYNPYAQASNTLAIQGLRDNGIDVPETITADWINSLWSAYGQYSRTTTTGYGPSAPTKSSSREQNIAYWAKTLLDDEENTSAAEAQLKAMADEVNYWAKLGYSDAEIEKRVRTDFSKKYNVLNKMDEERMAGDALRLNRGVDYTADTIYGMIWAARNDGGTGDYFTDAVKYTMGQGNKYRANPDSEAARDPSNAEGYHPYYGGSTMHTLNQKYGVTSYDQKWLDDNRWMLNDPEAADDWRKVEKAYNTTTKAAEELAALEPWLEAQLAKPNVTAEDVVAQLEAAISDGRALWANGKQVKLDALADMEAERKLGMAVDTTAAIDFTLPRYIDKIEDAFAEKEAAAAEAAEAAADRPATFMENVGNYIRSLWGEKGEPGGDETLSSVLWAVSGGRLGSSGNPETVTEAQVGAADVTESFGNFMQKQYGIDFKGALTAEETEIWQDAIAKAQTATQPGSSKEQKAEAEEAVNAARLIAEAVAKDESRVATYKDDAAYSTVFDNSDEIARGMVEGTLVPQAATVGPVAQQPATPDWMTSYEAMLGGAEEWNGDLFRTALANSTEPAWVLAELTGGILDQMKGGKGTAISRSWFKKFQGLTADTATAYADMPSFTGLSPLLVNKMFGDEMDSRRVYGTQVYDALIANEEALKEGAITADQYAVNLLNISSVAEAIGENATDEQAAEVLAADNGVLGAGLEGITENCRTAIADVRTKAAAEEAEVQRGIQNTLDRWHDGAILTEGEMMEVAVIRSADISDAAAADATYKGYDNQFKDALSVENIIGSIWFTTGNAEADQSFETTMLQQTGAMAYGNGVLQVAEGMLDDDMRMAAAYGMTLDEYYTEYPDRRRSSDQILTAARKEYEDAWINEFGGTIKGLNELNATLDKQTNAQESEDAVPDVYKAYGYDVDPLADATSRFASGLDLTWAKAVNFAAYTHKHSNLMEDTLRQMYGNDPAAYAADLDKWEHERVEFLQKQAEHVIKDGQYTDFDAWYAANPDPVLEELRAARSANVDIFKLGYLPGELENKVDIQNAAADAAMYDALVGEFGTGTEKFAYKMIHSAETSITQMATAAAMGGNYVAQVASFIPSGGETAYERYIQTGNYDAAILSSMGETVVNAAIEKIGYDRITAAITPNALSAQMGRAQMALGKAGYASLLKDPKSAAKVASGAAAIMGQHAISGGLEEGSQSVVSSVAENLALGEGLTLTGEQLKGVGEEALMGALMEPLFVIGGSSYNAAMGLNTFTDTMGNEIALAEAASLPEYEGCIINAAINIESTQAAIKNSHDQLAAIHQSAEYKQYQADIEAEAAAGREADAVSAELEQAREAQANAALVLDNLSNQAVDSDAFTEDMAAEMEAAAAALQGANDSVSELLEKQAETAAARAAAVEARQASAARVEAMYREVLDAAKAEAEAQIVEEHYNGDTAEQAAASENYRKKSAQLAEAKKRLRERRMENRDRLEHGRALLDVGDLVREVEVAKAELDAAYAATSEGHADAARQEELAKAEQAAQEAAAAAEADPESRKKSAARSVAEAQLEAVKARHDLDSKRAQASEGLLSPESDVRAKAAKALNDAQRRADAAEQALADAQAEYEQSDEQIQLRNAIDAAKQYTDEQLLFEDEPGHTEAVAAYRRLQLARAAANAESAREALHAADVNSPDHKTLEQAYDDAVRAQEDEVARWMGTDGDTFRESMIVTPASTQVLDAVEQNNSDKAAGLLRQILESNTDSGNALAALAAFSDGATHSTEEIANDLARQLIDGVENAGAIRAALTDISEHTRADHRATANRGRTTMANRNPIEIIRSLTKSIRAGYSPSASMTIGGKRLPKAVQAAYSKYANAIKTRSSVAGDLVVGLHEFAHAVQARMPGLSATQNMIDNLSDGIKQTYSDGELDAEAVAEFVVSYMFDRQTAVNNTSEGYVKQFEEMLANDKRLNRAIQQARADVELWANAAISDKLNRMVSIAGSAQRAEIGSAFSRMLRNIETGVFDMTAPAKLVSRDFHQRALYSLHAFNRADTILSQALTDPDTGDVIGASLSERLYDAGVTAKDMQAIATYSLARHNLDRIAQGKPVFNVEEFPVAAMEAYVKDVEANNENIVAGANALTSFWNDFVDAWLVETGLLDKDVVQKMREMYPHYVPTFRVVGENFSEYGGKTSRFHLRQAVDGGSGLEVINPMNSLVKQVQRVVNTVTQNQLLRAFHAEYQRGGLGEIAMDVSEQMAVQRNDITQAMELIGQLRMGNNSDPDAMDNLIKEMSALGKRYVGTGRGEGINTVAVIDENGRAHYYEIADKGLFNLLAGNRQAADSGLKALRAFKNVMTALTTGSNPLFAIKNMMRDFQSSVNTGTWAVTYADGIYKWIQAFAEVAGQSDAFKQWRALGGGSHTRTNMALDSDNIRTAQAALHKQLFRGTRSRDGKFATKNDLIDTLANVVTLKDFNDIIENTSRFVEYRFGKHDLSTPEGRIEAFMRSQDVTTNFGTRGAYGFVNLMRNITPFMNATLQGLHKDAKVISDFFSKDKAVRAATAPKLAKIVVNTALTAGLQLAILKLFKRGDTDDEEYALLSDSMKAGNLIIPIPEGLFDGMQEMAGFSKPYFRIPIAQGVLHQPFYAFALDTLGNAADYTPFELELRKTVMGIVKEALPTAGSIFQSVIDARSNTTWYGGQIEDYQMDTVSEYNRSEDDMPGLVVEAARAMGVSPAKADYVVQQNTGYLYRMLAPLLSEGAPEERLANMFNSAMSYYTVDPVVTNDISNQFYAARDLIDQTVTEGASGMPMGNIAYSANPYEALSEAQYLKGLFEDAGQQAKAIWNEINAIDADPNLSRGEKSRTTRELKKTLIPIYQQALSEFDRFSKEYVEGGGLNELFSVGKDFLLGSEYERPSVD